MDREKHGQVAKALEEARKQRLQAPPSSLEEAKLRLQLAAGQIHYPWISFIRSRPFTAAATALGTGLIVGRSARMRSLCGSGLKNAVNALFTKSR